MEDGFVVKNFKDKDYMGEEELLAFVNDFIEENVLIKVINDFVDEDMEYLRVKDREIRWLAAKARFRAIKINK